MPAKAFPPQLPGFNVPLQHDLPYDDRFPNALDGDEGITRTKTVREILMMRAMNTITDKPEWDQKVFNEEITSKWREEFLASDQDISPKMIDWIIKELQWKVDRYQKTGYVDVYDTGVVKSDIAVSEEVKQQLQQTAAPLEKIEPRDYHPRSDNKVVDLVHPSLFPVIYGRTRVLPDKTIGLDECLSSISQGELLPVPSEEEAGEYERWRDGGNINVKVTRYSRKYQWMPCDVKFTDDGCCITSYINNLHPIKHRNLYDVIEKILTKTIPLWERSLTNATYAHEDRIEYESVEYEEASDSEPQQEEGETDRDFSLRWERWHASRPIIQPEPGNFSPPITPPGVDVNLRTKFHDKGLQVIVKLANIELTPEKPEYEGGPWHIEGQLNERICATAIYYYDSKNITESTISFRHRIDTESIEDISYPQGQHEFLQTIYGLPDGWGEYRNGTQNLGSVVSQEGRLLTFPNILQHRVSPFELADKTKPGHRKILAFFLVDPHIQVISSANVPPQQEEWAKERAEVIRQVLDRHLPVELREMIKDTMPPASISLDEAKEYRLDLMDERTARSNDDSRDFEEVDISLCEH